MGGRVATPALDAKTLSNSCPVWKRVREGLEVASRSLPVVAMGSVPHIDRREGLSPGDPNRSCPVTRSHATYLTMSIAGGAERLQSQQAQFTVEEPQP